MKYIIFFLFLHFSIFVLGSDTATFSLGSRIRQAAINAIDFDGCGKVVRLEGSLTTYLFINDLAKFRASLSGDESYKRAVIEQLDEAIRANAPLFLFDGKYKAHVYCPKESSLVIIFKKGLV